MWHKRVEEQSQKALFTALQITHTPFDYVYLTDFSTDSDLLDKLKKYEVLFYPHATIMTTKRAALLQEYVATGGKLVFGCRSGYKDMTGKCVMDLLPGQLRSLTGADVFEYSFIPPDSETVTIDWDKTPMEASVFVDRLQTTDMDCTGSKIEAVYTSNYFASDGALVSNTYGNGKAYYYGTAFTVDTAKVFLEKLGVMSPYASRISLPEGCELAVRERNGKRYFFVLNYLKEETEIEIHVPMVNLYTGSQIAGVQKLKGYETLVLEV